MNDDYDSLVARHYAAYRPPLHSVILRRVFTGSKRFSVGLDVGCGTGRSAVALADFCDRVYGVDPSQSMLDRVTPDTRVTFLHGSGESIPRPNDCTDVATLAGCLFFADAAKTVAELTRVCRQGALIAVYDFEVLLADSLRYLEIEDSTTGRYDHGVNLSGLPGLVEKMVQQDRIELPISATGLTHLVLADNNRHDLLSRRYGVDDPFAPLLADLGKRIEEQLIDANIFYATYLVA